MSAGDVVRALYEALSKGDLPGVTARLHPDVVVDEPTALPYGGVHLGRDEFLQSVLGAMMGYATVEKFPLTMIELHDVVGETTRRIDVYLKDPSALAAFYARADGSSR